MPIRSHHAKTQDCPPDLWPQQEAALVMGVSRQTLANILKKGRYKVVECLSLGKALMMQPAEPNHQTSGEDPK